MINKKIDNLAVDLLGNSNLTIDNLDEDLLNGNISKIYDEIASNNNLKESEYYSDSDSDLYNSTVTHSSEVITNLMDSSYYSEKDVSVGYFQPNNERGNFEFGASLPAVDLVWKDYITRQNMKQEYNREVYEEMYEVGEISQVKHSQLSNLYYGDSNGSDSNQEYYFLYSKERGDVPYNLNEWIKVTDLAEEDAQGNICNVYYQGSKQSYYDDENYDDEMTVDRYYDNEVQNQEQGISGLLESDYFLYGSNVEGF